MPVQVQVQVEVQVQVVVFKCDASGNLLRLLVDGQFEDLRISNRLLFCHDPVDSDGQLEDLPLPCLRIRNRPQLP